MPPTGTNHTDNQPVHLKLKDPNLPINYTLEKFDDLHKDTVQLEFMRFKKKMIKINLSSPQNCIHCKTCDIKEPSQNIIWVTPEGGGGPKYGNM